MTQVADAVIENYLTSFSRLEKQAGGHTWLDKLRRTAMARFEHTGFPSRTDEEWRWTNLAPVTDTTFAPASPDAGSAAAELVRQTSLGAEAACEIVFVNGHFAHQFSRLAQLPRSARVMPLADALRGDAELLERHLGRYADIQNNPFDALNTGFLHDGAVIHLARGAVVEGPIHVLFVSTAGSAPTVACPRILVVAEENTEASVVETYAGEGGVYFNNAVTEIVVGNDARIDHCRLQQESRDAFHISTEQIRLGRSSTFVSHSANVGGRLTRNGWNAVMAGEFADATLNGLTIVRGTQHVDNHTLIDHQQPNCPSHELYKHVLDGRSSGVFRGKILVRPGAQKTDSKQTNKTLLLSDDATMNAQPALEIYADDVKCTHGSTTGPVDEDMVFYLRTRGVGLEAARHLLTYAFAADITRRIKVAPVRARLEDYMAAQHGLPKDLRITDLGAHDEAAR